MRIPHIRSNTPQNIFYETIKSKFLRIARSTLSLRNFIPKTKELLRRIKKQSSQHNDRSSSLGKIILAHPESLQYFSISCQDFLNIFADYKPEHFSLSAYICISMCINKSECGCVLVCVCIFIFLGIYLSFLEVDEQR